jgi:hypothetical protein
MTKYSNGVRIDDWFLKNTGDIFHYHDALGNNQRNWWWCGDKGCTFCKIKVPKQILMHKELHKLEPHKSNLECNWPVRENRIIE